MHAAGLRLTDSRISKGQPPRKFPWRHFLRPYKGGVLCDAQVMCMPPLYSKKGGEIMNNIYKNEELTKEKEEAVKKEEKRLKRIFGRIEKNKKSTIEGLIQRAAFMRISLDEMEQDINKNGFTEKFSQGNQEPYLRQRPISDIYNKMNTSYQKIVKQLTDLLPKEELRKDDEDEFAAFVVSRHEI